MKEYIISFVLLLIVVSLSSKFIKRNTDTEWYRCITPSITPPSWVFSLVWSIIYILLFFASVEILKYGSSFVKGIFFINLILQVVWSYFYFGKKRIDIALAIIQFLLLTTTIVITLSSRMQTKLLLYPYLGWLTFATTLNILSLKQECKGL